MKKRYAFASIPLLLTTFNSLVSSEAAWQQLDKDVQRSCLAISALQEKKIEGKRTDFSDDVGYSALVISGNYKFKNSNSVPGKELCLYNRKSKGPDWNRCSSLFAPLKNISLQRQSL